MIWFALIALLLTSAGLAFYQVFTPLWLNQFRRKTVSLIETSNGPIALLLVAIAELRGPISILERSIIERQLTSNLSVHAEATAALVDQAIDAVNLNSNPLAVLEDVAFVLKHKSVSVERQQYLAMAQRVARAHDGPTSTQKTAIRTLSDKLNVLH